MKYAILVAAIALAGCSTTRDPHAPKTIVAASNGGSITVNHGERLRIPLAADAKAGFEWRRIEPRIMSVVAEGAPDAQGFRFTPVRSGTEKLRFEYRPVAAEGAAQKTVSYDVTVR